MDIKGEVVKRTGVDPAIVDQVLNALGEIVSERYPQFAGLLGPALGINTGGGGAATGTQGGGAQGMPDMNQLGNLFGGGSAEGGAPQGGSQS